MDDVTPSTGRKALAINLDPVTYGVFSETGGGYHSAPAARQQHPRPSS